MSLGTCRSCASLAALAVLCAWLGCGEVDGGSDSLPPAPPAGDDDGPPAVAATAPGRSALEDFFDRLDVDRYLDVTPIRSEPGYNGYTLYYFDTADVRCFSGHEAHVAVSPGGANRVLLFLEGGGARWPGGGFWVDLGFLGDIGIKSRAPESPIRDWSFVYVPYCDASIHSGDSEYWYEEGLRYHHGVRHTSAAVRLMKDLFPDAEKVLVAGSSAGGYGTFYAWAIAKSQYMDAQTYIFNDSGTGFWNPEDPGTFDVMRAAWNLTIPDDCTLCSGTIFTPMYEVFLRYDPQVRIGMFSSYGDIIITEWFLHMPPEDFRATLLSATDPIHAPHPGRFARFFIEGRSHTCYEFLLPGGARYEVDGTSIFDWLGRLVSDDPAWGDVLE